MTESALQDIELQFAGKDWQIRPEFQTLVAIEGALGQPSRTLGLKCLRLEAGVAEVGAIVFLILRGKKDAPDREAVGTAIMADGYDDLLVPIGTYLLRAIRGSKEHEKEALAKKAAENPPTTGQQADKTTS